MGCGGSKEETEFKRDDGTDKRLVVGRVFTKPMLFKTFAAWQRFVVIRQAEKEEQRKLNDKIAEKEKVRKMTVMVAAPDEAKKKKPKAQAVSADLAASINSHVTKKENAKKDEKMEAEREKKERLAAAKKNMSPEDFRLMQERLIFEAAERDRKEQLPYGYFGSGGPVERGSMKPMWTGLLKRMVDKGYVEKAKFNIIDLLKPRKVAEPPAPAETGIWGGFGALQVWNSFMELGNAFSALGKTDTEEDLKKLFDEIDEDGSGTLEIEELQKVFKEKLNIDKTDEEIKRIFEEVKGVGADLESVDLADFRKIVEYVKSADTGSFESKENASAAAAPATAAPAAEAPAAAASAPAEAAAALDPADRAAAAEAALAAAEAAARPPPELSSTGGGKDGVSFASRKTSGLGRLSGSKGEVAV